jgi:hypothetical protein
VTFLTTIKSKIEEWFNRDPKETLAEALKTTYDFPIHDDRYCKGFIDGTRHALLLVQSLLEQSEDLKPIITTQELYESIQRLETDPEYRKSVEQSAKHSQILLSKNSDALSITLAKYKAAVLIYDESTKAPKLHMINPDNVYYRFNPDPQEN